MSFSSRDATVKRVVILIGEFPPFSLDKETYWAKKKGKSNLSKSLCWILVFVGVCRMAIFSLNHFALDWKCRVERKTKQFLYKLCSFSFSDFPIQLLKPFEMFAQVLFAFSYSIKQFVLSFNILFFFPWVNLIDFGRDKIFYLSNCYFLSSEKIFSSSLLLAITLKCARFNLASNLATKKIFFYIQAMKLISIDQI